MLRLESLQLFGFKSFADRTKIVFPDGITCIVGPNGCGKSNISDAVSWVLGEQSAKSLRGQRMEDVIFAGTPQRKPAIYAEVSMTWRRIEALEDETKNKLNITRKLYRNGTSEYFLNHNLCRLKDVQTSLMDFGMGSKAYSLIEQGRVGQILNSKPTDRRNLIEEAAGILKFKVRRHESELKLKSAEDNLMRINDIIGEVQRRRSHLNRQVGKARRYKRIKEEIREKEHHVILRDLFYSERQADETRHKYRLAENKETEVRTDMVRFDAQLASLREDLLQDEQRWRLQEQRVAGCIKDIHISEENIRFTKEKSEERTSQLQHLADEVSRIATEQSSLAAKREQRQKELEEAAQQCLHFDQQLKDLNAQEEDLSHTLKAATNTLNEVRQRLQSTTSQIHGLSVEKQQIQTQLTRLQLQENDLINGTVRIKEEQSQAEQTIKEYGEKERTSSQALVTLKQQRAETQTSFEDLRAKQTSLTKQLEEARQWHARQKDRQRDLAQLLNAKTDVSDSIKKELKKAPKSVRLLRDAIDSDHRFDKALDWILEPYLDAFVIDDDEGAEFIQGIKSKSGSHFFDLRHSLESTSVHNPPEGAHPILDALILKPDLRAALMPLFRHWVVAPQELMIKLAPQYPDTCFVSDQGTLLMQGAFTRSKGKKRRGFLALKGQIKDLENVIKEASKQEQKRFTEHQDISVKTQLERERMASQQQQIESLERDLLVTRQKISHASDTLNSLLHREKNLIQQSSQLKGQRAGLQQRLDDIQKSHRSLNEALSADRDEATRMQGQWETENRKAREHRGVLERIRAQKSGSQRLKIRIEDELKHLDSQQDELSTRSKANKRRTASHQDDILRFKKDVADLTIKINALLTKKDNEQTALRNVDERIKSKQAKAVDLETKHKEKQRHKDDLRAEQGRYELELARIESALAHLQERHTSNQGGPCVIADIKVESLPNDDDYEQIQASLVQLGQRLQSLGTVNLLAIEEFEEIEERFNFLQDQQKDLIDSIAEIKSTISKLNRICMQRFREAYEVINKKFSKVFVTLFGGGEARLSLLEDENPLEAGVDILVRPPGKKLQNVFLLSGGEKALTAIALLLAIFEYKPAPFCLLDEVDAPLDEANVTRFIRKLESMKHQTQFIIVTHHKVTMGSASSLFGVTMEDSGCSKLVSVKFD